MGNTGDGQQLAPGDWVMVDGLPSHPHLNGLCGKVLGPMKEDKQRWPVCVIQSTNETDVLVKPDNITPIPPEDLVKV